MGRNHLKNHYSSLSWLMCVYFYFFMSKTLIYFAIHPKNAIQSFKSLSHWWPCISSYTKYVKYVIGYYIMGKIQSMSGNTFLAALIRPLSLSDIKNIIEFANPAFWKCLRKYNQFSFSSIFPRNQTMGKNKYCSIGILICSTNWHPFELSSQTLHMELLVFVPILVFWNHILKGTF